MSCIARAQAAKAALRTVITPARARELAAAHGAALPDLRAHIGALLVEGVLSEDYVLQARHLRLCSKPIVVLRAVQLPFQLLESRATHGVVCIWPESILIRSVWSRKATFRWSANQTRRPTGATMAGQCQRR